MAQSQHPAYSSASQVDAVAACVLPNALFSDEENNEEEPELPLLAVAQSQLEGNVWSGSVALLDAATNERMCELQLPTCVGSLAWASSDGDILALGCDDGDLRLAKLSTDVAFTFVPIGGETDEDASWGHDDVITGVSVSKVEKNRLATSSWDLTVKLWDLAEMNKTVATFEGHTDLIWAVAMNPTHAHLLCSASQDSTVQVWDARRPQSSALTVATLLPALSVDWHPKQPSVFSVGLENGMVCTFDVRSPQTPLTRQETHTAAVHVLKYSPFHDDLLATGGDDGKTYVTFDSFSSSHAMNRELLVGKEEIAPHRDYVRGLDWFQLASESTVKQLDTMLATGSWDKTVHRWSANEYAAIANEKLPASGEVRMLAAPPGVPVA